MPLLPTPRRLLVRLPELLVRLSVGTATLRSVMPETPIRVSWASVTALMAIGTSCRLSDRFCAVTTISSTSSEGSEFGCALAIAGAVSRPAALTVNESTFISRIPFSQPHRTLHRPYGLLDCTCNLHMQYKREVRFPGERDEGVIRRGGDRVGP